MKILAKLASVPLAAVGGLIVVAAILLNKTFLALIPAAAALAILISKAIRSA